MCCLRFFFPTVVVFLVICSVVRVDARLMPVLDYRTQFADSDVVVIAIPAAATKDTNEHSVFDGLISIDSQQRAHPVESVGVETPFRVSVVLKGDAKLQSFTLHHCREATRAGRVFSANGPTLVSFTTQSESAQPHAYLMFLKRERDGRYGPTGGQVDPATFAVFPLPVGAQ